MKRSSSLFFSFILLISYCGAQESDRFRAVKQMTTLVVLEDDTASEFSRNLKYAVKTYWKVTKYEFITQSVYEKNHTKDIAHTFLADLEFGEDPKQFGDNSNIVTSERMLAFYYFVKEGKGVRFVVLDKAPSGFHTQYAQYKGKKEILNDRAMIDRPLTVFVTRSIQHGLSRPDGYPYYEDGYGPVTNKKLHEKTLLIPREYLDQKIKTEDEVKKIYPYPFKIVSKEEVKKYMDGSHPDIAFLVSGQQYQKDTGLINLLIVDGANGMKLASFFRGFTWLNLKDFKGLAKN